MLLKGTFRKFVTRSRVRQLFSAGLEWRIPIDGVDQIFREVLKPNGLMCDVYNIFLLFHNASLEYSGHLIYSLMKGIHMDEINLSRTIK